MCYASVKITETSPTGEVYAGHNAIEYDGYLGTLQGQLNALSFMIEVFDPFQFQEQHSGPIPQLARLDESGEAKPLTRIVCQRNPDHCFGPGSKLIDPEYEGSNGKRTPLS